MEQIFTMKHKPEEEHCKLDDDCRNDNQQTKKDDINEEEFDQFLSEITIQNEHNEFETLYFGPVEIKPDTSENEKLVETADKNDEIIECHTKTITDINKQQNDKIEIKKSVKVPVPEYLSIKQETESTTGSDSGIENNDECIEILDKTIVTKDKENIPEKQTKSTSIIPIEKKRPGRKSQLDIRSTIETDELYICELCDASFSRLINLNSHRQELHNWKIHPKTPVQKPTVNNSNIFECKQCNLTFKTECWYKKHMTNTHQNEKEFTNETILEERKQNELITVSTEIIPSENIIENISTEITKTISGDIIKETINQNIINENILNLEEETTIVPLIETLIETKTTKTVTKQCKRPKSLDIQKDKSKRTKRKNQTTNGSIKIEPTEQTIIKNEPQNEIIISELKITPNKEIRSNKTNKNKKNKKTIKIENIDEQTEINDEPSTSQSPVPILIVIPSAEHLTNNDDNTNNDTDLHVSCNICNARFAKRYSLAPHMMRVHTKEKSKICTYCGRAFTCTGDLTRHIRIHTKDKPFKCTYDGCTFAFISSGDLYKHARRHTKDSVPIPRPHKCNICHKDFERSYDLKRHMTRHKMNNDPNFEGFKCVKCNKRFSRKDQHKSHELRHLGYKPHECNICFKKFADASNCAKHIKQHTIGAIDQTEFICNFCKKLFTNKKSISKHMISCPIRKLETVNIKSEC